MDRYTKVVLTIIAATLWVVAIQNAVPQASTRTDYNCGWRTEHCHVYEANSRWQAISVEVQE